MQIALVYNPHMAPARLAKVAALARELAARGHRPSHHDSQAFRAADLAEPVDLICVCGGDGTAQLVIAGQGDCAGLPPIAVYPTGTINLLARELGYPEDPQAFVRRIEDRREPVTSRLAMINGRPFLCCVSVGADAHAVAALSETLKARIGRLAYLAALAKVMLHWPRTAMQVTCDGEELSAEALFVLRGKFYAGPWVLDPQAGLENDQLRLIALPRARRRDLLALILHAMTGAGHLPKGIVLRGASKLTIRSAVPVPLQIDGDAGGTTPLDITMSEARVRFV